MRPHRSRITTAAANRPRVSPLPQPQSPPLVIARSRLIRPAVSPMAPGTSNRPDARSGDSGTTNATSSRSSAPITAAIQKSACQSACWAMNAASGSPMAPPTPRVALIRAIAEPSRSGGSSSRMMLIPSGITPIAHPWSTRPMTTGTRPADRAQTTDPITMSPRLPSSTRRLPYRSPSLPLTGLQTAAASSVDVITQDASDAEVCRRRGRSGMSGTTIVCISETTMPHSASTATTSPGPFTVPGTPPAEEISVTWRASESRSP